MQPRLGLYSVTDFTGQEMPGLAIILDRLGSTPEETEQYAVLTTSFGEFIGAKDCAYIDTNNCYFAPQLLEPVSYTHLDDGRMLPLAIGVDRFRILPPEARTVKFYMPLTAEFFGYDEWGDREEYGYDLNGRDLRGYEGAIRTALVDNRKPAEADRGMMHWYDEQDGVNDKVQSCLLYTSRCV